MTDVRFCVRPSLGSEPGPNEFEMEKLVSVFSYLSNLLRI